MITTQLVFADCLFRVINYSLYPVTAKVGFYNGKSQTFKISNNGINSVNIVNEGYNCIGVAPSGTGVSYITLIGKNSQGAWRYIPISGTIMAVGSNNQNGYVIGKSDSGNGITLINNYKPESSVFEVQIKPVQFRDTKNSSSN